MRIKLMLENCSSGSKRKLCFFLDNENCSKVADLCYLIKKRFYDANGSITLLLDGFLIPPQEDIKVIKENDVINVKYYTSKSSGSDIAAEKHSKKRKGSTESSTSQSSSSDSDSDEDAAYNKNHKVSNGRKTISSISKSKISSKNLTKTDKNGSCNNALSNIIKNVNAKGSLSGKKTIPISKLGISKNKAKSLIDKSENSDTSTESSSSSSSSSEDENVHGVKSKAIKASRKLTGNAANKILPPPVDKSLIKKKYILPTAKKVDTITSKKSKISDSSSDSSDSSDISSDTLDYDAKKKDEKKESSNIDFHVSKVTGKTSTPSYLPTESKVKTSNGKLNGSARKKAMSGYKNVSSFVTSKPFDHQSSSKDITNDTLSNASGSSACISLNTSSNISSIPEVTGKVARRRRRRQKRQANMKRRNEDGNLNAAANESGKDVAVVNDEKSELYSNNMLIAVGEKIADVEPSASKENKTAEEMVIDIDAAHPPSETKSPLNDYSSYALLTKPPNVGDVIAYKIMELSSTYEPDISDYKEGCVKDYDSEKMTLQIHLSESSLKKEMKKRSADGKFEMPVSDNVEEEQIDTESVANVSVSWNNMIEPRIVEQNNS